MTFKKLCLLCSLLTCVVIYGGEEKKEPCPYEAACLDERTSVTNHRTTIEGKPLSYTATAGTLVLKDKEGKPQASIFYTSYVKDGEKNPKNRPVTFCFNGGPGSSSVWLHLGFFGPKKVATDTLGNPLRPYRLEGNEFSPLDVTDVVFIDPVSTGYSRAAPGVDPKKFHGVKEDIQSVGEFIRLWLTRSGRWTSPKYIAGESYGTTRAAGLANHLHEKYFIDMNGIILISCAIDFQTFRFQPGNDLPYITFLPTYTTTAWYHKKLPKEYLNDFQRAIKEASEFALNDYAHALMLGDKLSDEDREQTAEKLSLYTGLDKELILKNNLRVDIFQFSKQLLGKEERLVGRFDSRFTGIALDPAYPSMKYDPSLEVIAGAFTATVNDYFREELKWKDDQLYEIIAKVMKNWNFGEGNQYLNMNEELFQVLTKDPHVRVFSANGYYDLATPFFATDYTFNHIGLDKELRDHIQLKYYDAGHMIYTHRPSLIKLKKDLKDFYKQSK